ncbi:MAG TPA: hypothetical protein VFG54_20330 [Prolixibacteraceae bacterium]|nr:hypothetical protein [Prolixibacteraceae bacterium]
MNNNFNLNQVRKNYITNKENVVVISSLKQDRSPYVIEKISLDDRRNHIYSDWILHLMDKTWIEKQDLYELAVIIRDECPRSEIDWFKTFFAVEMQFSMPTQGIPLSCTDMVRNVTKKLKSYNLNYLS